MVLQQIYDKIKEYALNTQNVNNFTIGDVYTVWNALNMKYGAFNVLLNQVNVEDNNMVYYFTFYYGDKLFNDSSNVYTVQQNGFNALRNVLNHLKEDFLIDEDNTITMYPFWQSFSDILAGAYCDIQLIVPIDDNCINYDK